MADRAFTYIFALIYPALLGTFLFAAFIRTDWQPVEGALYLLMLVYFHVQYGESLAAQKEQSGADSYGPWRAVQDMAEVVAMVLVFAGLGSFAPPVEPTPKTPPPWLHRFNDHYWPAMAVAFAIPPIFRSVRYAVAEVAHRPGGREQAFGPYLTSLSLLAMIGCVVGDEASPWTGAGLIAVALTAYLALFVVLRERTAKGLERLRERTAEALERLRARRARISAPAAPPSDPPQAIPVPDDNALPKGEAHEDQPSRPLRPS